MDLSFLVKKIHKVVLDLGRRYAIKPMAGQADQEHKMKNSYPTVLDFLLWDREEFFFL